MDYIRPKWPFVGTNFPFLAILTSQVRVRVRVVTIFIIVVDASPLFTRLHVRFYLMKQSLTHPRRPRGSQSGRKRRDESLQVRAKEPLGTDSHRTIPKNSSGCQLLIGHKKCFVLLCPIGEQFLLSSFREFVHDGYCLDHGLSGSCTKEMHAVRKLSVWYKIPIWFQNIVCPKTKDAFPKIQAWAYNGHSRLHRSRLV